MALGEIRCEERSNFWSYIYLGSFGATQKREAGTKSGCETKSISYLMRIGTRHLGRCMHSFMGVHETSNRVKSKFLPKVQTFYYAHCH